ncbi:unnamed protein product [Paramecium octaurelia]|uniref:Uncharacterized protein n=1 Tax=Paramecium octaurelia TaxID=43137 RepID=A0A8S1U7T2_PAROT|nr:unnamed protein product [Paramecium octaurelia]
MTLGITASIDFEIKRKSLFNHEKLQIGYLSLKSELQGSTYQIRFKCQDSTVNTCPSLELILYYADQISLKIYQE